MPTTPLPATLATVAALIGAGLAGCGDPPATQTQPSPGCLAHSDADYDVVVSGTRLGSRDGADVHVLTSLALAFTPDQTCATSIAATIAGGTFDAALTNRTDGAAYPLVAAYIDVDGDGVCTGGVDLVWSLIGSVAPGQAMTVELTAEQFGFEGQAGGCDLFQ